MKRMLISKKLCGDVTGLYGDVDECELTLDDRASGVEVKNLVQV